MKLETRMESMLTCELRGMETKRLEATTKKKTKTADGEMSIGEVDYEVKEAITHTRDSKNTS